MDKFKFLKINRISDLPKVSGVYCFQNGKEILYIGKASSIRERVKNHFRQPVFRDGLFIKESRKVGYIKTDSEIEALLLEAELIKRHQPKYNVLWRDDKNYFFVAITEPARQSAKASGQPAGGEKLSRIFLTHQIKPKSKILNSKFKINYFGPFVEGASLKKTLRLLRKVFPYYTAKKHPKTLCPYCYLELCPGPDPDPKEYRKNIRNIVRIFKGGRHSVLRDLRIEMKKASSEKNFEKAAKIRDQARALENIIENAKIISQNNNSKENWEKIETALQKIIKEGKFSRIEAYDISNIQGKQAVGSMVVFIKGEPVKGFYRKFKIRIIQEPNDIAMLKECITRRLRHKEWPYPGLMLIDGGKAQLNIAKSVINSFRLMIPAAALAKRNNELYVENRRSPVLLRTLPREISNMILHLSREAHRFAIKYHRKLRKIDFVSKF